jgi:hypothetical protein
MKYNKYLKEENDEKKMLRYMRIFIDGLFFKILKS